MPNRAPNIYISQLGPIARTWWLFRRAWIAAFEDNCFGIAKGAAYSALLSIFPVMTTTTALLVQANAQAVSRVITKLLFEVAPPGTQDLLGIYLRTQGKRPGLLLATATVLSVWAASGAMMTLMEGFQAAYSLPGGRSFLRQRAMAALLVVCAVGPLVLGSAMILFGTRSETAIIHWLGLSAANGMQLASWVIILSRFVRSLAAFGCITLAAALLFYLGPNRRIRFASVWPGALIASLLWLISTQLFGWYVSHLANYNVLYGSVAAVIALLVWMYVLAVVALVGCEFNVAAENEAQVRREAVSIEQS
jgi:membrane protein